MCPHEDVDLKTCCLVLAEQRELRDPGKGRDDVHDVDGARPGIWIDYTNLKRPQQGSSQPPSPFLCFERLGLRAGSGGGTDLQDGSHDVRGLCAQDPDMF